MGEPRLHRPWGASWTPGLTARGHPGLGARCPTSGEAECLTSVRTELPAEMGFGVNSGGGPSSEALTRVVGSLPLPPSQVT